MTVAREHDGCATRARCAEQTTPGKYNRHAHAGAVHCFGWLSRVAAARRGAAASAHTLVSGQCAPIIIITFISIPTRHAETDDALVKVN